MYIIEHVNVVINIHMYCTRRKINYSYNLYSCNCMTGHSEGPTVSPTLKLLDILIIHLHNFVFICSPLSNHHVIIFMIRNSINIVFIIITIY